MVELWVCPVCFGRVIMLHDVWGFSFYFQCLDCGSVFKNKDDLRNSDVYE